MPERIDIIGRRYGKLTVTGEDEQHAKNRRLICRCDCGNEAAVLIGNLRSGNITSCGCASRSSRRGNKRADLIGKRFGRLLVVSFDVMTAHGALWECRCDCGNTCKALTGNLNRGFVASCGCLQLEVARKLSSSRRKCTICGKRFFLKDVDPHRSKTCSPECKSEWDAREKSKRDDDKKLLTQSAVARLLGVSRAAVSARAKRGTLPPYDTDKSWNPETIQPFIDAKKTPPSS